MEYLSERIAYLRGLAEGLDINETSKEGKMFLAIIDTLEILCDSIEDLEIMEDIDFICPNCNEPIEIDDTMLESQDHIICPKCKESIGIITHDI